MGLLYLDLNGVLPYHFVVVCSCLNFEHCMTWLEILAWSCCTLGFREFLNCWVICELVNLCFRSELILWRKACGWLEVCSLWRALNLLNMCSMKWTGYKMMLSECFLAWTSVIIYLKLVLVNSSEYLNGIGWCQHKIFGGEDQKSWNSKPATRISVSCKSRRRHWGWLL